MSARLKRGRVDGQSIPLLALLIVVLIGAVGLAVDVGNDYAQQRNTVRATNAAALAGMNTLIRGGDDQAISNVIRQSLKSNNIDGVYDVGSGTVSSDQRIVRAYYLDAKGNYISSCIIGSCGSVPSTTTYIQVKVEGTVDTYFARVLQRPTLPVHAQAFAGRCAPVQGVYPIAVQSSTFDKNGFAPPTDPTKRILPYYNPAYQDPSNPTPLTMRRIYVNDDANSPGNFSWLKWKGAKNAGDTGELYNMVKYPGNLAEKFDEVTPWPATGQQAPTGYPVKPNEINTGDWVHVNTGVSITGGANGIGAALDEHVTLHDVMILPIVSPAVGQGIDGAFQVTGLGAFYMVGRGGNGADAWFDLVYIGEANSISCLSTPAVASNSLGVFGPVLFAPRWNLNQGPQPIAYEMIMDVSGSMSWNFGGQGSKNGSGATLQCEDVGNIPAVTCAGGDDFWKNEKERRIYVLKHALTDPGGFISSMKQGDQMRILAFSTDGISKGNKWYGKQDASALTTAVMNAGTVAKYGNDPYRTSGGTPGPQGIQAAAQVLANNRPPATTNGLEYRHVVIYMTDGVANVFLDGVWNFATDVCSEFNHQGDTRALNTPRCQYDQDGYPDSGHGRRPISAMIDQANRMKQNYDDMQLFVIALAQVNPFGLDQVASSPKMLYLAGQDGLVKSVLGDIINDINRPCTPSGGAAWADQIDAAHTANFTTGPNLPMGVYGYVYLKDDRGAPVNVPWVGGGADPRPQQNMIPITQSTANGGGKLAFEIPPTVGLSAGVYHMTAYVNYKAAQPDGDGISRQYDQLKKNGESVAEVTFTLTPSDLLGSTLVLNPLRLDLNDSILLCPS
jgi:hypothetical protein